uniref:Transcription cofactor vestigial-like protein 4 n=1 Tax=Cacopsylla melanoneura TaxID=428564 RepID=A0A8D8ZKJ7_9HEMI
MESTTESPLDVLSRAATMVQDNIYLPPPYDEARPLNFKCKDVSASSVSGGKWKRERKSRQILVPPPDYASHQVQAKHSSIPEPLDMSRKARGSPPPYTASLASRTVNTPSNTTSNSSSSSRASVIISSASTTSSPPLSPTGSDQGGSTDPVIDEHFRRSLGADYLNLYKCTSPSPATPAPSDSALSVDDHFAKALGETWIKLQEAESKKSSSSPSPSDHSDIRRPRPPSSTSSTLSPPTSPLSRHHSPGVVPI